MEEKILLESENLYKDKLENIIGISISGGIIGYPLYLLFFEIGTVLILEILFSCIAMISVLAFIISIIIYLYVAWTKLTITDKRIYGQTIFGKRVDLPLDSISSVGTRPYLGGLAVATSSGRIVFWGLTNRNDLHECISELLIRRNEDTIKNTSASSSNTNLDDIIKLKTLLDEGIITQEEFEAKKKQLLGL